ncbi:MAG TPA: ribonuclease P protein component [Firmicutes bacterium]|nr:ribonuclease P protein component [Bacillota bacterium]
MPAEKPEAGGVRGWPRTLSPDLEKAWAGDPSGYRCGLGRGDAGGVLLQFDTLKLNKEFRRLYGRGKSKVHPALVTYALKNRAGYCRIGITTSKKVGCAVRRNRARRVILAAWRQVCPQVAGGYDLVFVARTRTPDTKSTELEKAMRRQLISLGLIPGKGAGPKEDA